MGKSKVKTQGGIGSYRTHKYTKADKKKKIDFNWTPKGQEGERKWFTTRKDAMDKLHLTTSQFQRLCVLKGVHPREPKKKFGRPEDTYYHSKDIDFLKNDPIITNMREGKIYERKVRRFLHRDEKLRAENMRDWHEPYLNLARIVKERYASFEEAIKDSLDDCLSTLCLIAQLPGNRQTELAGDSVEQAAKLIDEFYFYVAQKNLLRKGFISVKGFYFSARVAGHDTTWLHPFEFAHDTSEVVDFSPMVDFTEFYLILMRFINYRLYTDAGFQYPPVVQRESARAGLRMLAIDSVATCESAPIKGFTSDDSTAPDGSDESEEVEADAKAHGIVKNDDVSDDEGNSDQAKALEAAHQNVTPLKGLKVFINREVPLQPFALVLKSMGAEVGWTDSSVQVNPLSPFPHSDNRITYHIYDRPRLPKDVKTEAYRARSIIQPQWVFDSLNSNGVAAVNDYGIGMTLPVHLSPWHAYVSPETKEAEEAEEEAKEQTEERQLRKALMTTTNRWLYDLPERQKKLGLKKSKKA